ncbi:MAG: cytochrome b/b6 domain-containing protein [OCS116 cluster bacterium]|nr:cytochrome b/b6 domain-containing protein [OCS116 cluster bacterium]
MLKKQPQKTQVWDIYIRVFHWLLTFFVLTSFISIKYFDSLTVHFISGYCIIGLLVFRLVWGLVGSETARFVNFVRGPSAIIDYIKSLSDAQAHKASYGHSPIAALSVVAMLVILVAQVLSGLFFYDEEIFLEGPLAQYGSADLVGNARIYHPIGSNLVMFIIGAHLVAIAVYYILFKQNLVRPMIVGWRKSAEGKLLRVRHIAAFLSILCALIVVVFVVFFGN